jgi:hypothetical protein
MPRPITTIIKTSGDYVIEGILDDGTPDASGRVADPQWLRQAVAEYLSRDASVRTGLYRVVGTLTEMRAEGDTIVVRARIFDITTRGMITGTGGDGILRNLSYGISRPVIVEDDTAPGGRITDGILMHVAVTE